MQFRDLKQQYHTLKAGIDKAILDVAASGAYVMGPAVVELERMLADYVGTRHCLSCASGTDALMLALKAWGIGHGDAVFVPDFTFFASAEAVSSVGATPVLLTLAAKPSISILPILKTRFKRRFGKENCCRKS